MSARRFTQLLSGAALLAGACGFPEHDFIPADEFEKLKNDASTGGVGAIGGFGGFAGSSGGAGGVDAGLGGVGATGGSAGVSASGGVSGSGPGSCAGRCGQNGAVPGSSPKCYCDDACDTFKNCCEDYNSVCGSGGTGASGGTGGVGGAGGAGASGGTGATGATGGMGGTGGGPTCAVVVINEVSTQGASGSDEFVELYNAGTCTANLAGWTLKYSSALASSPATRWTGGGSDTLAAGGYFVVAGSTYPGASGGALSSGLANEGGIGLLDDQSTLLDSVAWGGVVSNHPYIETAAFSSGPLPANESAARTPNGFDSNDNSKDFQLKPRSAGAGN